MNLFHKKFYSFLCALLCSMPLLLQANPQPNILQTPLLTPVAPTIEAKAYVLQDANSGNILLEKNANERLAPASLTKLMTLYITFSALKNGQLKMEDTIQISESAWKTGGSRMFVKVGSTVPVQDLLSGIIVASGNDASVAMAEHIGGSQDAFVDLMNKQAQLLGMKETHFTDATGLPDPQHYTTAHDMAILAAAIINDFPEYYHYYKVKTYRYNNITQTNRNRLLWVDPSIDGIKTGHTDEAGFCVIASAQKNGMRLIAVMLGADSDATRTSNTKTLLEYGFRNFETIQLFTAQQPLTKVRVFKGEHESIPLGLAQNLYVTIPRGQLNQLKKTIAFPRQLQAPIEQNQSVGTLTITLNDKTITAVPLLALKPNPSGSLWTRIKDSISMSVDNLLG